MKTNPNIPIIRIFQW